MQNNPLSPPAGTQGETETLNLAFERAFIEEMLKEDAIALFEEYDNKPNISPQEYYFLESSAYRDLIPAEIILLLTIYHKYREPSTRTENSEDTADTKDTGSEIRANNERAERQALAVQAKGILISHSFAFINKEVNEYTRQYGDHHLVSEMIERSIVDITIYFDRIDPTHENFSFFGYIRKSIQSSCIKTLQENSIKLPRGFVNAYRKINELFPYAYSPSDININRLMDELDISEIKAKRMIYKWLRAMPILSVGAAHSSDTTIQPKNTDDQGNPRYSQLWDTRPNQTKRPTEEKVIQNERNKIIKTLVEKMRGRLTESQLEVLLLKHLTTPSDLADMIREKGGTKEDIEYLKRGKPPTYRQIAMILGINKRAVPSRYNNAMNTLKRHYEFLYQYSKINTNKQKSSGRGSRT